MEGENEITAPMTGREALKQKKEIMAESCRRLREKQVSLPYHKPKQRSLKEFLQNRPKFAAVLPQKAKNLPASVAIKMTTEELEEMSKKLEEREKVVMEEFYESESDQDDDKENDPDFQATDAAEKSENSDSETEATEKELENQTNKDEGKEQADENKDDQMNKSEKAGENESEKIEAKEGEEHCKEIETKLTENTEKEAVVNEEDTGRTEEEQEIDYVSHNITASEETCLQVKETEDHAEAEKSKLENLLDKFNFPSVADGEGEEVEPVVNFPEESSDSLLSQAQQENNNEPVLVATEAPQPKLSKAELLRQKLANIQPKLSGGPGQIIDLEEGVTKPSAVALMVERFFKHNSKPDKIHKDKVFFNVHTVAADKVLTETVSASIEKDEFPIDHNEKPGTKLLKLRQTLQEQIAQRRIELLKQKQKEKAELTEQEDNDTYKGEKETCGVEDDILDDEEEEEMEEGGSSDSEAEENDEEKAKAALIDGEAEEDDNSENEGMEVDEDEEQEQDANEEVEEENEEKEDEDETNKEKEKEAEKTPVGKKKFSRIVFEDSDEEDGGSQSMSSARNAASKEPPETTTFNSRGSWDDDDSLPPNRPMNSQTPIRHLTQGKPDLSFLTPISRLTGLQGSNSASKLFESPIQSPCLLPQNEPSPLRNMRPTGLQKNLFSAESESEFSQKDSQAQMSEIADLCSGRFPETQEETPTQNKTLKENNGGFVQIEPTQVTSQELMDVCSGDFGPTFAPTQTTDETSSSVNVEKKEEQTQKPMQIYTIGQSSGDDGKNMCFDDDTLITQLLDEDDYKKKFENDEHDDEASQHQQPKSRILYDSDDEEDQPKKRKAKIVDSDDSDADDEFNGEDDEEIDLHDPIDDDEEEEEVANPQEVDYDSEENEVVISNANKNEPAKEKIKLKDFIENEAELSESEWGSADEDEKDMNQFEEELGDKEQFDERKLHRDLEKIHMRQILDEDQREVKILQEMLLEDGELHGQGRQRQFRWRNIDNLGTETDDKKPVDDDDYQYDEECEFEWRKKRYEREMFLKSQEGQKVQLEESLLDTSQVFKLGEKVISANATFVGAEKPKAKKTVVDNAGVKFPFALSHRRGSLLTRKDNVLERLAKYSTKIAEVSEVNTATKSSRNFVFQAVDSITAEGAAKAKLDKKRKATEGTPKVLKKMRLSNNFSPAVKKIKSINK